MISKRPLMKNTPMSAFMWILILIKTILNIWKVFLEKWINYQPKIIISFIKNPSPFLIPLKIAQVKIGKNWNQRLNSLSRSCQSFNRPMRWSINKTFSFKLRFLLLKIWIVSHQNVFTKFWYPHTKRNITNLFRELISKLLNKQLF